jgi:type II secretory pathway pseudopilin PulG
MLIQRRNIAGDTLIEVLFAVTVFSLVAVSGLAVMNQGSSSSERALEITLVREQMDGQAKTLRFLNSSYVAAFRSGTTYPASTPAGQWALMSAYITAHPIASPTALGETTCPASYPLGSFVVDPQLGTYVDDPSQGDLVPAKTFAQINYTNTGQVLNSEGIWIEAIRSSASADPNQSHIGYIDFHILSCWDSPGQSVPVTLGTIVRLYEPR